MFERDKPKHHPVNFVLLLGQLNAVRAAVEFSEPLTEMPKGKREAATKCPIARALSNGWKATADIGLIFLNGQKVNPKPDYLAIVNRLRQAGFKYVKITRKSYWIEGSAAIGVEFSPTKTMENFIMRFDRGHFAGLIEGKR